MKWETIKRRVANGLFSQIREGRSWETMATILIDGVVANKPVSRKSFEVYAEKASQVIMAWDVRCVGRLRELFPGHFPPSLLNGPLFAEYDDNCDWDVVKA